MDDSPVLFGVEGSVGVLALNRPDNRNSMDAEVLPAFEKAIKKVRKNRDLRCLIITGTGKSFCAGADFKSGVLEADGLLPNELFMKVYSPFLAVGDLEIPTIAAMNGHAIGGGLGLALICDMRVASLDSKYGANFARLGVHSGMAISYLLPRLVGLAKANELLFTGRLFNGRDAFEMGLVNYALPASEVMTKAMALAEEIAASAPAAVRMMKQSVHLGLDWNPVKAAIHEAHCQSRTFETDDAKEGISALLEKRQPDFSGK